MIMEMEKFAIKCTFAQKQRVKAPPPEAAAAGAEPFRRRCGDLFIVKERAASQTEVTKP